MNDLPKDATLRDVNALKKQLNWGDVPPVYHLAASSIGELEGISSHGFENPYTRLFNKNYWNLEMLGGFKDEQGNVQVKTKPKIQLRHVYTEQHYELHCYPVIQGERITRGMTAHPMCAFSNWIPEAMQMLFRVNSLVSFIIYAFEKGDQADLELIKLAHNIVQNLMNEINESFDITAIKGLNIAQFCQELSRRKTAIELQEFLEESNQQ